jgi:hypothetical protein
VGSNLDAELEDLPSARRIDRGPVGKCSDHDRTEES